MYSNPKTEDLVSAAKGGERRAIKSLLSHAWYELTKPTEIYHAALILKQETRVNRERVLVLVARLFGRAGADAEQIEILSELSDRDFAPAIYCLGLIYEEKGHYSYAVELFGKAKDLGFKVAASKYYWCKRKDAKWPLGIYYYFQAVRHRWSSLYLKFKTGAVDEAAVWKTPE